MDIVRIALGAIAQRGAKVTAPTMVTLAGPAEADFLGRHVARVRGNDQARAKFVSAASVPALMAGLGAATDKQFVTDAATLQQMLAAAMATATTASDCVTALVHAKDRPNGFDHFTVLKLDSNVEAGRRDITTQGVVNLTVLTDLLPTPKDLQKALSWPDLRPNSDALVVDTNPANAQYFEKAYEISVSPKSAEAETSVRAAIAANVSVGELSRALQDAAQLTGPADQVLTALAQRYQSLAGAAQRASTSPRPAGIVRPNKVAVKPVVWSADGVELKVPADRASDVVVTPDGNGFILSIRLDTRPKPGA